MTTDETRRRRVPRPVAAGAVALGLVAGSYGIASAASGNGSSGSGSSGSTPSLAPSGSGTGTGQHPTGPPPGATAQNPWGNQRSDETPLTGTALARVTAAAKAKVPGGTIVRVETDADGHAAYEAHMLNASGTPVTVYVDKSYTVTGVESR